MMPDILRTLILPEPFPFRHYKELEFLHGKLNAVIGAVQTLSGLTQRPPDLGQAVANDDNDESGFKVPYGGKNVQP